jgi:outer membrane lipoprotein SlyB
MSDEAKKPKAHVLRLTNLMLAGALIGAPMSPAVGSGLGFWLRAAPVIAGAIAGLLIELRCRVLDAANPR